MSMSDMMNMASMKEGVVEAQCNSCSAKDAPLRLRAAMVNAKDKPQNLVPAIVLSATRQPPMIKTARGIERNPAFDPLDVVPIATWELVEEICNDESCYHACMDRLWKLGQQRLKVLWS
jgi:hypothetical protein